MKAKRDYRTSLKGEPLSFGSQKSACETSKQEFKKCCGQTEHHADDLLKHGVISQKEPEEKVSVFRKQMSWMNYVGYHKNLTFHD